MEKFTIGLVLGSLGGALLVANSYKMRMLVKKGQEEAKMKFDELMDERLDEMEKAANNAKEKAEEKIEEVKEKVEKKKSKKTA